MISHSTLTIQWLYPDIEEERREFFTHPDKQEWYRLHSVTWEQIISRFDSGALVPYPRSSRIGEILISPSYHRFEDYQTYVFRARRSYRRNYSHLESDLQKTGNLALKAPIILANHNDGLLFSGYRRLCLAWNYGMIPYIWLVQTAGGLSRSQK
ncbi:MAG: hypothetical protein WCP20_10090 [Desulfuromonadales bacterium]